MHTTRVLLIGGPSNVGKSTLAATLATRLGWHVIATDSLARHPGRPWATVTKAVPEHVAAHYTSLSIDELIADVVRHYGSMQPQIRALVAAHASDAATARLVMEGSALWPEFIAPLRSDSVAALWLTASDDLLRTRIYTASQIEQATPAEKLLIDKFVGRTLRYNAMMRGAVARLGLHSIHVDATTSVDELSQTCVAVL